MAENRPEDGQPSKEAVLAALSRIQDPDLHRDIVSLGFVRDEDVTICGGNVKVTITLTTPACPVREQMKRQAEELLLSLPGVTHAEVEMQAEVRATRPRGPRPVEGVRNIIAVASNKGGVGKSTIAVNLALALRRFGARVGLLDADLTGPNVPTMLGLPAGFQADRGLSIVERYGLKVVSLGFLLKPGTAVIWRGPMIGTGVRQLLHDIPWGEDGELDYLVVDLPPGTSDASMSLAQEAPVTGVVIVTAPNAVSVEDSLKAVSMFERLSVPVLGVVENMSYFVCPHCGQRADIFGHGLVREVAARLGLEFLGEIPLDPALREAADRGLPAVEAAPDSPVAQAIMAIAQRVAAKASVQHFALQSSG
ncbi:MAG: Mrp/NBP35 family ATP-binding protein [Dehalococcoidia bacterium]|jgi:ATP-binding protein involved in chromosome partitioning|nr:Mrp/NBP35 family ATP-binding protein [Dehalococcoidia bacterium]MDW8007991.1 Mrp/NBP35 family ATP-binding protein [Chloroflexota bacterium]HXG41131.1 Mrp/NBP35 family ATP-binding protein [Dehalococcoidia bacterium]